MAGHLPWRRLSKWRILLLERQELPRALVRAGCNPREHRARASTLKTRKRSRRDGRLWVPRTPFGLSPEARSRLCSDTPCTPRVSLVSAYRFCQRIPFHARARIPDCLELGNVDRLAARRVSVGLEERPATQRFCTRAASRRAGRGGGGNPAAATQHLAPAHRSAAWQAASADRASDGADACCSAARIRGPRARGGGGRQSAIGRGTRAERFRPSARRAPAPSAPAPVL